MASPWLSQLGRNRLPLSPHSLCWWPQMVVTFKKGQVLLRYSMHLIVPTISDVHVSKGSSKRESVNLVYHTSIYLFCDGNCCGQQVEASVINRFTDSRLLDPNTIWFCFSLYHENISLSQWTETGDTSGRARGSASRGSAGMSATAPTGPAPTTSTSSIARAGPRTDATARTGRQGGSASSPWSQPR